MRKLRSVAFMSLLCGALLANTAPASAERPTDATNRFSIEALVENKYSELPKQSSLNQSLDQGVKVMLLGDDKAAVVDSSLASAGLAAATKTGTVELSWVAQSNAHGYTVVRDNVKLTDLASGANYYQDQMSLPEQLINTSSRRRRSLRDLILSGA